MPASDVFIGMVEIDDNICIPYINKVKQIHVGDTTSTT